MRFDKPPKTFAEQVELLITRGMEIEDPVRAERYLSHLNYYRLAAYWLPYELCATIPFTRNLIEYTRGEQDEDYLKLTSLLHWKNDTEQITVGNYLDIYNRLFGTLHETNNTQPLKTLLFTKSSEICARSTHDGLNLEDKVLLSMATRQQAEIFVTNKLRTLKNDATYWCQSKNQFGVLMEEYATLASPAPEMRTLEKVGITVSSNIHLNSFMYEPILDLTIDHLVELYKEVCGLSEGKGGAHADKRPGHGGVRGKR